VTAIRRAIDAYLKGLKYIMAKPSWKNRRRYIFASFVIGAFMLVSGSIAALTGNMADISDLVTGGVALISLILTSYVFGAVWEDKTLHNKEENPDG
jgi:hypothetical protein